MSTKRSLEKYNNGCPALAIKLELGSFGHWGVKLPDSPPITFLLFHPSVSNIIAENLEDTYAKGK